LETDYESKFYSEVLLKLSQYSNHLENKIKWICFKIIELMSILSQTANKNFVKNALITILTNFMDIEYDYLMNIGHDLKECPPQSQEKLYNILKK
jgi:hypothetical protein